MSGDKTITLSLEHMVRFTCGAYTIERGPDTWRFVNTAGVDAWQHGTSLEDLHSLAAVAHAASRWVPPSGDQA